jgi:hypothetical protein
VCIAAAMYRPRAFWFALSGVLLGISLLTYQGAILPGGLGICVVALRLMFDGSFRRLAWPSALLVPAGIVVGAAPLLTAYHLDPTYTMYREHQVSVFTQYSALQDQVTAIASNLRLHLLMFFVQGDGNGRHNLPGAPMLDPTMATLFVLGLGICIRRLKHWFCQLLLVWLAAGLAGGVFSLTYEAPQGARSIGAVAPIALIAALPLALLSGWLRNAIGQVPAFRYDSREAARASVARRTTKAVMQCATAVVVMLPICISARDNYEQYFVQQVADPSSWSAMSGLQAVIGRTAFLLLSEGYTVPITPDLASQSGDDPALTFAARGESFPAYDPELPVPLPVPAGGFALIIPSTSDDVLAYVERSYPTATVIPLTPRADKHSVVANVAIVT